MLTLANLKLTEDARQRVIKFLSEYIEIDTRSLELYNEKYIAGCMSGLIHLGVFDDGDDLRRECLKETGLILPYWLI